MFTVTGGKLTTYRSMAAEIVDCVEEELGHKPSKCVTADKELPGGERAGHLQKLIAENPVLATPVCEGLPYTFAELRYGVSNEMALTLADLLMRRTRVAFDTPDHGLSSVMRITENVAEFAGWDKYQKRAQLEAYTDEVARVFSVDP
jgi:glycerol-3-phosphate dehydrogenase